MLLFFTDFENVNLGNFYVLRPHNYNFQDYLQGLTSPGAPRRS